MLYGLVAFVADLTLCKLRLSADKSSRGTAVEVEENMNRKPSENNVTGTSSVVHAVDKNITWRDSAQK
jgi:hypothetical protein